MKKRWLLPVFASFMVLAGPFTDRVEAATNGDLTKTAYKYIGTPYVYGGTSTSGFDCSGYTQRVFADLGYTLARTSSAQYGQGSAVSKSNLVAGDLVFFNTSGSGVSHVGIFIGNGQFIHSSSSKGVVVSQLSESYWANRYVGAKRVITLSSEEKKEVKETEKPKQEVKKTQQPKQEVKKTQQPKQEVKVTEQPKQEVKVTQQPKQEVKATQQEKIVVKVKKQKELEDENKKERITVVLRTPNNPTFFYTAMPQADAYGLEDTLNETLKVTIPNELLNVNISLGYRYTTA